MSRLINREDQDIRTIGVLYLRRYHHCRNLVNVPLTQPQAKGP